MHESLAIVAERCIGSNHWTRLLDGECAGRGSPAVIRSDDGLGSVGEAMLNWSFRIGVSLKLIEPGKQDQPPTSRASTDDCAMSASPKRSLRGLTNVSYAKEMAENAPTVAGNSRPYC